MEELIKIKEENGKQAVSARELYKFLEATERFSNWFERQLQYGFVENQDFTSVKSFTVVGNGAEKPVDDYALTIDCAKEISMIQRNEKGKIARQYFIEVEKRYMESMRENPFKVPATFREALLLAAEQQEKIEEQERLLKEQEPKVLFAKAVETSEKSCLIGELAKILRQNGVDTGEKRLFAWMRDNGYLCRYGERYNQPTQKAMELELFELKKVTITKPNGDIIVKVTPKITGKGQIYFVNKFLGEKDDR